MTDPSTDTLDIVDAFARGFRMATLIDAQDRQYDIARGRRRPLIDLDRLERGEWTTVFTGTLYEVAVEFERLGVCIRAKRRH